MIDINEHMYWSIVGKTKFDLELGLNGKIPTELNPCLFKYLYSKRYGELSWGTKNMLRQVVFNLNAYVL